jgi:O-acetyl-ADP-ribose deacetylase (regulator of RNase III)
MLVHDLGRLTNPRYVINFPTKRHWKGKSRMEDIEAGLPALVEEVRRRGIRSIAVPPLGCGLGGLAWREVRPRIERAFQDVPNVRVLLYEPVGAPVAVKMAKDAQAPKMTVGRAALVGLMRRYIAAAMDPVVSLLEIHKLMYLMQSGGEPLKLRYRKAQYGPYTENLRHVLNHIEGHFITGYGDAEDRPDRQLALVPAAAEQADAFLRNHGETQRRFERVAELIEGFETPYGMELLTTVHWVATQEGASTPDEVVNKVYDWSPRKRMFPAEHIRVALDALSRKGWVAAA